MEISPKYADFLKTDAKVEFLEGTTYAGKTTIGFGVKFIYKVLKSSFNKHLIAGESIGTVESNILNCENGILDIWGNEIQYYSNGNGNIRLPHLKIKDNVIYLVGYSDIAKFKKVLGGQFGVVGIDEINIANMDFIREIFLPRFEYLMGTLNPDNPDKEIYSEFINRSRPIEKYKELVPSYIWEELEKVAEKKDWVYWFFTYKDNPIVTEEKENDLLTSLLPETREYQTKILGKRTKGTGLIFILPNRNIKTEEWAKEQKYKRFTCGIDTSYSKNTDDTFALIYQGITLSGELVVLEEEVYNNKGLNISLSPSDMAMKIDEFFIKCNNKWGLCKTIFIDSADAGTISECRKFKRNNNRSYDIVEAWKKLSLIDRINLQNGWIAKEKYLIVDTCINHIKEHYTYSWLPNKDEPEDANDHTINASQYGWLPYKQEIGV
jgi:hypothetical protein